MNKKDYSTVINVKGTMEKIFENINDVRGWWTKNFQGNSQKLHDEFSVQFDDVHYSKQKLVEVIPAKKVVWLITDSRLNFIDNKNEWTNTRIIFEIFKDEDQHILKFTHEGLRPEVECFDACTNAWSEYIHGSLQSLINTGTGNPAR